MAKGFGAVLAAQEDIKNRKNSGGGTFVFRKKLFLKDGDEAIVRFLEQGEDVTTAWFHQTEKDEKYRYGRLIPCRDQDGETGERIGEDCPGCDQKLKRKFQIVLNLIWRDAPVYGTDDDGKTEWDNVIGYEDQVVVWQSGSETADELQQAENDYNGLSSTDFKVRRRGAKLDTKYSVVPADVRNVDSPMSDADKELANEKYDLNEIIAPPSFETWGKSGATISKDADATEVSAFMRKRA